MWFRQTSTYAPDGDTDAARAGAIGDYQTSWIETTVKGPGSLVYWDRTSCQGGGADRLVFYIDGEERTTHGGDDPWNDWEVPILAGTHTLRWAYEKNVNEALGEDTAWLDQVVWTAPEIRRPLGPLAFGAVEVSGTVERTSRSSTTASGRST